MTGKLALLRGALQRDNKSSGPPKAVGGTPLLSTGQGTGYKVEPLGFPGSWVSFSLGGNSRLESFTGAGLGKPLQDDSFCIQIGTLLLICGHRNVFIPNHFPGSSNSVSPATISADSLLGASLFCLNNFIEDLSFTAASL